MAINTSNNKVRIISTTVSGLSANSKFSDINSPALVVNTSEGGVFYATGDSSKLTQLAALPNHTHSGYLSTSGGTLSGDLSILFRDTDKFVMWDYDGDGTAGASWRIGAKGTGIANTNYFTIQSGTATVGTTTWTDILNIGQNDFIVYFTNTPKVGETNVSLEGHTHSGYLTSQTWRPIKINNSQKLANSSSTALDISAGSNISLTWDSTNNRVTIAATDNNTDTKVTTSASSSKLFIIGKTDASKATASAANYNASAYIDASGYLYSGGTKVLTSYTDTKNTTGADNTTSKIFLVGPTAQTSSNGTARTYSNSSCYASGGYLYSGGTKVSVEGHGTHITSDAQTWSGNKSFKNYIILSEQNSSSSSSSASQIVFGASGAKLTSNGAGNVIINPNSGTTGQIIFMPGSNPYIKINGTSVSLEGHTHDVLTSANLITINRTSSTSYPAVSYQSNGTLVGVLGFDTSGNLKVSPNRTTNTTYYDVIHSGNYTEYCASVGHSHSAYYDANVSRTKNTVLAAPNGSAGGATFRSLVAADIPDLSSSYLSTSGGSVKGTITSYNIVPATDLTYNIGTSTKMYTRIYARYIDTAGANYNLRLCASGAEVMNIGVNKNVYIGGSTAATYRLQVDGSVYATNFITSSDKRLKENFSDISNAEKSLEIPFYEFDYKDDKRHSYGHIAQDVQEIFPEAVAHDNTDDDYLSLDYTVLHTIQIKALLDRIEKLEEEIKQLKSSSR